MEPFIFASLDTIVYLVWLSLIVVGYFVLVVFIRVGNYLERRKRKNKKRGRK